MANENIDFTKFNFLFPELGWWDNHLFTCDNFYVIPKRYFEATRKAMEINYRRPRPEYVDTHGLLPCLELYIPREEFHFISNVHEISDINSYYTCCRSGLPENEERMKHINSRVKERFGYGSYN
jgi:hypothetical protein